MCKVAAAGVALVLVLPLDLSAQSPAIDDWHAVQQLTPGTRVVVVDRQNTRISGKVNTASDDALELSQRWGSTTTLSRTSVRDVRLDREFGPRRGFVLGLLLGGMAGNLAGRAACRSSGCRGEDGLAIAAGTLNGMLLGGMGGAAIGQAVTARPGPLIYRQK